MAEEGELNFERGRSKGASSANLSKTAVRPMRTKSVSRNKPLPTDSYRMTSEERGREMKRWIETVVAALF